MKATTSRPRLVVSSDGLGVIGHAGPHLLADLTDATGPEPGFVDTLASLRQWVGGHAPERVAVDLPVMLADGGEEISDLALLRDQAELFDPVASDPRTAAGSRTSFTSRPRPRRCTRSSLTPSRVGSSTGRSPQ